MPSSTVVVAIAVAYLVLSLVVGAWPGRRSSDSAAGYVAGDRSLGLVVMYFITGATIFSAFAFLGLPGRAYSQGGAAYFILAYGTLGILPFYFLGPRAARLGRRYGFVTPGEMVAHRFDRPAIAGLMALISAAAFVPYLALQMKGAGYVFSALTRGDVSEEWGAAIVYGVVLAYVWKSGVLGVGWTNTLQGLFMMVLAWGLGFYLPHKLYGGVGKMFQRLQAERPDFVLAPGLTPSGAPWNWAAYSTSLLVSAIGFSFWPHLFMKAFTAKSDRTLQRTVVLYPTFQLFLLPILIIGFAGALFPTRPDQADEILPFMLMNMELSSIVVGLFCAGALAASMSSGDAIVHAAASILVRDGLVTSAGRRFDPNAERRLIRWFVLVVMLLSYVLAVRYGGTLVDLLLYAYGPVTQFAPAVIATLYWRRATGTGVLLGLAAGIAVNVALLAAPHLKPWPFHEGVFALAANVTTLVLVSLATRRRAGDDEYLRVAAGG